MSYVSGGTLRGALRLRAPATTPALSGTGEGRIYFDGAVFRVSENGGAYVNLAGGGTLASVLAAGNTTGGTSIVVSAGDSIQGAADLVLTAGGDLTANATNTTITSQEGLTLFAGDSGNNGAILIESKGSPQEIRLQLNPGTPTTSAVLDNTYFTVNAILMPSSGIGDNTANINIETQSGSLGGDGTRLYITPNLGVILELGNTIKILPDGTNNWIYGDDATVAATAGEPLTLRGGQGNTTGAGGELRLRGGAGGATGSGSDAVIVGGAGGSTSGAAGGVSLGGGTPTNGNGGSVAITGSDGVGTNRDGGGVTINLGSPTGTGARGAHTISFSGTNYALTTRVNSAPEIEVAGDGSLALFLYTGQAQPGTDAKELFLWSGFADSTGIGNGGPVKIQAGDAGTVGAGGSVDIQCGPGGTTSGNGGAASITAGGSTSGDGGSITILCGSSADGEGGDLLLQSGNAAGVGNVGGDITLIPGSGDGNGSINFMFPDDGGTAQWVMEPDAPALKSILRTDGAGDAEIWPGDSSTPRALLVRAGNRSGGAGDAGYMTMTGGVSDNGNGGDCIVQGGAGGGEGYGGDLLLDPGNGPGDAIGSVYIANALASPGYVSAANEVVIGNAGNTNQTVIIYNMTQLAGTTTNIYMNETPYTGQPEYPPGMWVMHPVGEAIYVGAGTILMEGDGTNNRISGALAATGSNATGEQLWLSGGAGDGTGLGGPLLLTAGPGGATADGALVTVAGGAGGTTSGNGGGAELFGGTPTNGDGGYAYIYGSDGVGTNRVGGEAGVFGGSSTGTATGGQVSMAGGTGGATGVGGSAGVFGGLGGSTSGNGGNAQVRGGNAQGGNSSGGQGMVSGADGFGSGSGGGAVVYGGNGGATGTGGSVSISAGTGGATSGDGGSVTLQSGPATDGNGGDVLIFARDGTGTNRDGGDVTITAGIPTGTGAIGAIFTNGRVQGLGGPSVASAADIALGRGNVFLVTGTTTVNTVSAAGWRTGSVVILYFNAAITISHAAAGTGASFALNGSVNFPATAGSTLTVFYDGTVWRETSRMVA